MLVGDGGRIVSGGALTTARRVKERAAPEEIHLGPAAAAQSAGAAWTDASDGSHRLLQLVEGAPAIARRPDAPLVGRRSELERLVLAVRESAASASCRRVVVLGEPGIGKTRIAAELVRTIEHEARVLLGRCVPYADGATYLPLADVVRQVAAGEELGPAMHAVLDGEPDGEQAAARLVDALSGSGAVDSGDVFWAARKLLEALAREGPVVVVLEDVHWAEPTFLDLVEYVAGWSAGAPITLLCLARTELLDERPAWAADTIALRPLSEDETGELLGSLPEALALDSEGRAAVVSVAEGNPLFLEQLAAHALDAPLEPGRVPASLESLLASRLDSLKPGERAVLERAAIVGREFTRAAVDALAPDDVRGSMLTPLMALVRRRLVRPDTERVSEDAFLFDHALIRDATYAAVAKAERARLHEQLARWLDQRGEIDEIVGYHLEQAVLNQRETGGSVEALAEEAAERLARPGERAVLSRDHRAAIALLTRAIALFPDTSARRLELECMLSVPFKNLWQSQEARSLLDDVARRADELGSRRLELRAKVEQVWPRTEAVDVEAVLLMLEEAARVCEGEGDLYGVARAWGMRASAESRLSPRFDQAVGAAMEAARCYERLGAPGLIDDVVLTLMEDGSTPLANAIAYGESRLNAGNISRAVEGSLRTELGLLRALIGDMAESRELLARGRIQLLEVGDEVAVRTGWAWRATYAELLAENPRAAAAIVTPALEAAERHGDVSWEVEFRGQLAGVALLEGEYGAALVQADLARERAFDFDLFNALAWRLPRARALLGTGRRSDGEKLASDTVNLVDSTDHMLGCARARMVLAEALADAGRREAAVKAVQEAGELFGAKGATLLAQRAHQRLASLRDGEPAARAPRARS